MVLIPVTGGAPSVLAMYASLPENVTVPSGRPSSERMESEVSE